MNTSNGIGRQVDDTAYATLLIMKRFNPKVAIILVAVASIAIFVAKSRAEIGSPGASLAHAPAHPKPISYAKPVLLQIPKIGVNAKIQAVGLTSQGNMDVPSNIVDVGWYKLGANPGNVGSAVVDGHLDGSKGQPGVFAELSKLSKGDKITVQDGHKTAIFVVGEVKVYAQLAHPEEVFHSTSGSHLNLITCTGSWDNAINRYSSRLVVFADLVK